MYSVQHANRVLDWQENLSGDELPPSWMWPFEDELDIWFDGVDRARKEKYGGGTSRDEDVPQMQNELAAGRRG